MHGSSPNQSVVPHGGVLLEAGEVRAVARYGALMQRRAMRWDYVLRNRQRWVDSSQTTEDQSARARRHLREFGVSEASIGQLALAGHVDVVVPYREPADPWEARVFPWEYVLSAATRPFRGGRALHVSRRLVRIAIPEAAEPSPIAPAPISSGVRVLYIESAPCGLDEVYSFDSERRLLSDSLGMPTSPWSESADDTAEARSEIRCLEDPTLGDIRAAVRALQPTIIHVAGFDTHQGLALLRKRRRGDRTWDPARWERESLAVAGGTHETVEDTTPDPHAAIKRLREAQLRPRDGVMLQDSAGRPDPVPAELFAEAVTEGTSPPALVCFNIFNSGPRVAALCVGLGARAAIGFQDEFDDVLTESFYESFYREWQRSEGAVHAAFRTSWDMLRAHPKELRGTAVMLWTDYPAAASGPGLPYRASGRGASGPSRTRRPGEGAVPGGSSRLAEPEAGYAPTDYVELDIKPLDEINYALLHNRRSLFERFRLVKRRPETVLEGISVTVELHAGGARFPCKLRLDLRERSVSLAGDVHVPLTSDLARSLRERVRTSLYVEVCWGQHTLHQRTYSVVLLPIDEWRNDERNRSLLPSFVLPTDPAVRTIVQRARKYLHALSHDVSTGFDGYQSDGSGHQKYPGEQVDRQVSALWITLSSDYDLSYVNPPPVYASNSQRLRTPSDVVRATHGTCIDLALLLAACLEYVDIHPVVVLLRGHAFPGYWRTEEAHRRFQRVQAPPQVDDPNRPDVERLSAATLQAEPWYVLRDRYEEISGYVDSGDLVLLETVELTSRGSFWQAVAEGERNLRSRAEFKALMDVMIARRHLVTPVPISIGQE